MFRNEGLLSINDLINTVVCVEIGLDILKDNHGTVSATSDEIISARWMMHKTK